MNITSGSPFKSVEINVGYGNAISKQIPRLIFDKLQNLKKNILQSKLLILKKEKLFISLSSILSGKKKKLSIFSLFHLQVLFLAI